MTSESTAQFNITSSRMGASLRDDRTSNSFSKKNLVVPSNEVLQAQWKQVEDIIKKIPPDEKKALLLAQSRSPQLVETESDVARFIRQEASVERAANKLVSYWSTRLALFQADRAFLPMTQTGQGALSTEDLAVLNSWSVLPIISPALDRGKPMLLVLESSPGLSPSRRKSLARCLFYILTVLSERPEAQSSGIVMLHRCGSAESSCLLSGGDQFNALELANIIPIRIQAFHFACPPESPSELEADVTLARDNNLGAQLKGLVLGAAFKDFVTYIHSYQPSPHALAQQLASFGIESGCLPHSWGGQLAPSYFKEWQTRRIEQETRLETTVGSPISRENIAPRKKAPTGSIDIESIPSTDSEDDSKPEAISQAVNSSRIDRRVALDSKVALRIDEIIQALPSMRNSAYLEAKERDASLIEKESNPMYFLEEDSDGKNEEELSNAAKKIALYWEKRKILFSDRAFLPMTQTGEGALGRSDLHLLGSGFLAILPNDRNGRAVLCYDPSRLIKTGKNSQLRVAFYLLSVAYETSEVKGEVVFVHVADKQGDSLRVRKQCIQGVLESSFARVKMLYAFHFEKKGNRRASTDSVLESIKVVYGDLEKEKIFLKTDITREQAGQLLQSQGFRNEGIPISLGGSWGYESYVQWLDLRTRLEWDLPAGIGTRGQYSDCFDFSHIQTRAKLTEGEKWERKRKMNVLHSRRKRKREKIELDVLQEQCDDMREKNQALREENDWLEGKMEYAKRKVSELEFAKARRPPTHFPQQGGVAIRAPLVLTAGLPGGPNVAMRSTQRMGQGFTSIVQQGNAAPSRPVATAHSKFSGSPTGSALCGQHSAYRMSEPVAPSLIQVQPRIMVPRDGQNGGLDVLPQPPAGYSFVLPMQPSFIVVKPLYSQPTSSPDIPAMARLSNDACTALRRLDTLPSAGSSRSAPRHLGGHLMETFQPPIRHADVSYPPFVGRPYQHDRPPSPVASRPRQLSLCTPP